ncbi:LuxR C-terminal-related transcriptional regulator [Kitasatospora sp. NPDC096147]|uniref:LuxR C-terminal-related transcriptional regulator n=1 Tax=Kitasatospora sp. NPDC096147 TaxID=3364093 RepID=UPI00380630D9
MLTTLGLDTTAEAVYRAMLMHPQEGVAGLVAATGLSEAEVRGGLDLLSELALVRPSYERSGELRAVSPDVGMDLLMSRQQAELASQQLRVEASRAAAARLIAEYAEIRPATAYPGVEQLVGLDAIRGRLASIGREARDEVMTFSPGRGQPRNSILASRPLNQDLLDRGVRIRTVYLESCRNEAPVVEHAEWLTERGAQVRLAPSLPTRMIITDRSTVVIPVHGDDSGAAAVVLTGHGTVTALCALFENVWSTAQPVGVSATPDANGLTPQEATAVRLLAEGYTDEAIGKRLGVSQRTARRIATELMERLNARSRFEAGAKAVQHGWLPHRL